MICQTDLPRRQAFCGKLLAAVIDGLPILKLPPLMRTNPSLMLDCCALLGAGGVLFVCEASPSECDEVCGTGALCHEMPVSVPVLIL